MWAFVGYISSVLFECEGTTAVSMSKGLDFVKTCCRSYCAWTGVWIACLGVLLMILLAMDIPPFAVVKMLNPSADPST